MIQLRVGQFWQGRSIIEKHWVNHTVVQIKELPTFDGEGVLCKVVKSVLPNNPNLGCEVRYPDTFFNLDNWRQVNVCWRCWAVHPIGSKEVITCWKCEVEK